MGYQESLEAAGATVHAFNEFGSYQGDWFAFVTYNGETGWINGSYGSCSGCDAFQGEFNYSEDDEGCEDHRYDKQDDCEACTEHCKSYLARLAEFGKDYLDTLMTQEQIEAYCTEQAEWSLEDEAALVWVKQVASMKG